MWERRRYERRGEGLGVLGIPPSEVGNPVQGTTTEGGEVGLEGLTSGMEGFRREEQRPVASEPVADRDPPSEAELRQRLSQVSENRSQMLGEMETLEHEAREMDMMRRRADNLTRRLETSQLNNEEFREPNNTVRVLNAPVPVLDTERKYFEDWFEDAIEDSANQAGPSAGPSRLVKPVVDIKGKGREVVEPVTDIKGKGREVDATPADVGVGVSQSDGKDSKSEKSYSEVVVEGTTDKVESKSKDVKSKSSKSKGAKKKPTSSKRTSRYTRDKSEEGILQKSQDTRTRSHPLLLIVVTRSRLVRRMVLMEEVAMEVRVRRLHPRQTQTRLILQGRRLTRLIEGC